MTLPVVVPTYGSYKKSLSMQRPKMNKSQKKNQAELFNKQENYIKQLESRNIKLANIQTTPVFTYGLGDDTKLADYARPRFLGGSYTSKIN